MPLLLLSLRLLMYAQTASIVHLNLRAHYWRRQFPYVHKMPS